MSEEAPAPLSSTSAQAIRLGGLGALLSGVVFLVTIAYTFGFLFARGLSMDMLDDPSRLLPWVNGHGAEYVGLWWIFVLHLLLLLPAPVGLAAIAGRTDAAVRASTVAGIGGAIVGMMAAMVNAASAPVLGRAAAAASPALLPNVWLMSELAGSLGLQLRLLSDLLVAVWLTTTGLALTRMRGWRGLGYAQLAASALVIAAVVTKPFDWFDLEPSLGFVLALVYLWMGVSLLRARR